MSSVLQLAQRQQLEEEAFARFLRELRDILSRRRFPLAERAATLSEYLAWRRDQGVSNPPGDEQPVVDVLVSDVLKALGYGDGDVTYNQRLAEVRDRAVPDYTVRVREFLGSTPVLLVENKATTVVDLEKARRTQEEGESPLAQLRRYVLSGAVHSRIGLLCNGWKLEAWQFGADGDARLAQLDLEDLAKLVAGDFPGKHKGALRAFWNRFSRAAFEQAHELVQLSGAVPPAPPELRRRLAEAAASVTAGALDVPAELFAHYERVWKEHAVDVGAVPERLVEALRGLIGQFTEDVLHQLEDALRRSQQYDAEKLDLDRDSKVSRNLASLSLFQPNFALTKEAFERDFVSRVAEWCRMPRLEQRQEQINAWVAALEPEIRISEPVSSEQIGLAEVKDRTGERKRNAGDNGKRKILAALRTHLQDIAQQALEDYAARQQLEADFRVTVRTATAYRTWAQRVSSSVLVGAPEPVFRREFARQTAYVYMIRLLLVRICEDKELFQRKLSDGGLILWREAAARYLDYASGRSYEYLTRMAYECAQNVYVHFYGASELFDWYRLDEKMLLRALIVLNAFNLETIDTDIIGAVYGRYLEEGKHEQGRYYTPKALVTTMLDMAGYRGAAVINRRIADIACGSGSFLVEACRRLLDAYRDRDGRIPTAQLRAALEEVQRSIFGLELNPFACYLAETNLLIQVLDLIRQAQREGVAFTVERFQIYCTDSLLLDPRVVGAFEASLVLLGKDTATAELLKARAGPFSQGFDFLVGNPPYVRADEDAPEYLAYRRRLEQQDWFTTRHLKWDLYVPFVEQYHRLLADHPEARCCLVTIESIANAPYAAKLREHLARRSRLHEILFLERLRLFEEADWQSNVVFTFSRGVVDEESVVRRLRSSRRDAGGLLEIDELDALPQLGTDPDQLFSTREASNLDLTATVPLGEICYVSVGMVLNSSEKVADGALVKVPAEYDPAAFGEELVEDRGPNGKVIRHRSFKRDELVGDKRDSLHTRPYLDSREVLRGGIGHLKWLEYGPPLLSKNGER